jgi:hypothetical protein
MREALLVEVRHDHDSRAQQLRGCGGGQAHRPCAGYENRRSCGNAGVDAAVIPGGAGYR